VGCTTGSRGEVPGEREPVIRDDDDDDDVFIGWSILPVLTHNNISLILNIQFDTVTTAVSKKSCPLLPQGTNNAFTVRSTTRGNHC
jgi:hypothetical protein